MPCTSAALLKPFATGCCALTIAAAHTNVVIQVIRTVFSPLYRIQKFKKRTDHAVRNELYDTRGSVEDLRRMPRQWTSCRSSLPNSAATFGLVAAECR